MSKCPNKHPPNTLKIAFVDNPMHCRLTHPPKNPRKYPHRPTPYIGKTIVIHDLHSFAANSMALFSFKFLGLAP